MHTFKVYLFLFFIYSTLTFGQGLDKEITQRGCAAATVLQNKIKRDSAFKKKYQQTELQYLQDKNLNQRLLNMRRVPYRTADNNGNDTITVVFHIVLDETIQKLITDATINDQIRILNEDFNAASTNVSNTPTYFRNKIGNGKITFALARTSPNGVLTDGIDRVTTNNTYDITDDNSRLLLNQIAPAWNTQEYLNVWIVNVQSGSGVIGLATFPSDGNVNSDGVWASYRVVGSYLTNLTMNSKAEFAFSRGRTVTHEIGHFLNLSHIWADEPYCDDDDGFDDTPQQKNNTNSNSNTQACDIPFPQTDQLCGLINTNNPSTMFMNYMDYTEDACMTMFTLKQIEEMRNAIYVHPNRKNLILSKKYLPPFAGNVNIAIDKIVSPHFATPCTSITPEVFVVNKGKNTINKFEVSVFKNNTLLSKIVVEKPLLSGQYEAVSLPNINVNEPNGIYIFKANVLGEAADITYLQDDEMSITVNSADMPNNVVNAYTFDNIIELSQWLKYNYNPSLSYAWYSDKQNKIGWINNYNLKNINKIDVVRSPFFKNRIYDSLYLYMTYAAMPNIDNENFADTIEINAMTCLGKINLFKKWKEDIATISNTNEYFSPTSWAQFKTLAINISKYINQNIYTPYYQIELKLFGGTNNFYISDFKIQSKALPSDIKKDKDIFIVYDNIANSILLRSVNITVGFKEIKIFSITGELVKTISINDTENTPYYRFSVYDLPRGTYAIQALFNDNTTISKITILY